MRALRKAVIRRDDAGWYACRLLFGHCLGQRFYPNWEAAVTDSLRWVHR